LAATEGSIAAARVRLVIGAGIIEGRERFGRDVGATGDGSFVASNHSCGVGFGADAPQDDVRGVQCGERGLRRRPDQDDVRGVRRGTAWRREPRIFIDRMRWGG